MKTVQTITTESTITRRLQALLRAMSLTQRSAIAGMLTVCAMLASGAAIAPARNLLAADARLASTAPAAVGGDDRAPMSLMLADGPGGLAGMPVSMHMPGQRGFLGTQMAFLGETGSEFQSGDDGLLPNPESFVDGDGTLLREGALVGRMNNHGGFGAGGQPSGPAGAMTAAWMGGTGGAPGSVGAGGGARSGTSGRSGAARASETSGVNVPAAPAGPAAPAAPAAPASNCSNSGKPCVASELVLALAPVTVLEPGKVRAGPAATAPGRSDGGPPPSQLLVVKDLPATSQQDVVLMASVDAPAVAVPEPGSIALLAAGVALLTMFARRRVGTVDRSRRMR